jgi:hypothetical protein
VGIRLEEPRMPSLLVSHRRPGFYLRVLEEGTVEAGQEIVKVAAGPEGMTVAAIDALLYLPRRSRRDLECAVCNNRAQRGVEGFIPGAAGSRLGRPAAARRRAAGVGGLPVARSPLGRRGKR